MTGLELAAVRKRLGWTQALMADRLGIRPNSLARLERGERGVSEPLARLAQRIEAEEIQERLSRKAVEGV